jgi:hypothetical protein
MPNHAIALGGSQLREFKEIADSRVNTKEDTRKANALLRCFARKMFPNGWDMRHLEKI